MRLDLFLFKVYNKTVSIITDITAQKRNKNRVNVYIDGDFACGLDAVTAVSARLKIGDEISVEALKDIAETSEVNSAFERAVGYLSSVPRAKREIARYLGDKGYDKDVISKVIERLEFYHYIDDRAYAQTYIRSKTKKYGSYRIAAELKQKGVDPAVISELLEENDSESDMAVAVAQKYIGSRRTVDKQRVKRFLAGRGFSWDSISQAIGKLCDEGAFSYSDEDD